jgi:hypothetical protein
MMVEKIPLKKPLSLKQAKRLLQSKEMRAKLLTIKEIGDRIRAEGHDVPDPQFGPSNDLQRKRLEKIIRGEIDEPTEDE